MQKYLHRIPPVTTAFAAITLSDRHSCPLFIACNALIWACFFQYDALNPPRFVGILNFRLAYTDELFQLSVQNTLAYVILPVPIRIFGAFLCARLFYMGSLHQLGARRHPLTGYHSRHSICTGVVVDPQSTVRPL